MVVCEVRVHVKLAVSVKPVLDILLPICVPEKNARNP